MSLYKDLSEYLELVKKDKKYLEIVKSSDENSHFISYFNKFISSSPSTGDKYEYTNTLNHLYKIKVIHSIYFHENSNIKYYLSKRYCQKNLYDFAKIYNIQLIFIKIFKKKDLIYSLKIN